MAVSDFVKPGYGRKLPARILTVDRANRRIEASIKDGGMVHIAVYTIDATFRWPKTHEVWMIRMDNGLWRLDSPIDLEVQARTGDDTGTNTVNIEDLHEGGMRVSPEPTSTGSGYFIKSYEIGRKISFDIGDGSNTTYTLAHNMGTLDVTVAIRESTPPAAILDFASLASPPQIVDENTITIEFLAPPTTNQYRATILG